MQLPAAFIQSIEKCSGFDKASFEAAHQSGEQLTSIRLNPGKSSAIQPSSFSAKKIPWSSQGYYLQQRPSFTLDPLFHAGAYYVQEASSMFLEEVMRQTAPLNNSLKVLDLCAAPGGKSTLLQSIINTDSLLVSNEVIKTRVNILAENITKWGASNVIVTNNDAKDFQRLPGYFDVIVVDAPCSGSGLFRKDPTAINEWSEQNVQLCSQRQQRILADVMPALKNGGILIYSTCSYSEEEDEGIADWLVHDLSMQSIQLDIKNEWGIVETISPAQKAFGYRFYPGKVKGEGFFIAAFKKSETDNEERAERKQRSKTEKLTNKEADILTPFIKDTAGLFFFRQHDDVIAMKKIFEEHLYTIQNTLYIKKAGVKIGVLIRNELVPDHELALSNLINSHINSVDVDEATALQYLRKQDMPAVESKKGWALVTYMNQPLGWIKILPNRINNYYPKEWRILNK